MASSTAGSDGDGGGEGAEMVTGIRGRGSSARGPATTGVVVEVGGEFER